MEFRTATSADLSSIWPRLAPRTTDEFKNAGFAIGKARGYFRDLIKAGSADAIANSSAVIAIMGWELRSNTIVTSFAGTDAFFEPSFVRPFKKYLDELQIANSNYPMVSHSFSEHPRVAKWFSTLGFTLEKTDGVHREFVRPPQK